MKQPLPRVGGVAPAGSRVRTIRDLWIVGTYAALCFVGLVAFDGFERFALWSRAHEAWQLDELLMLCAVLTAATAVFTLRRWQELRREIVLRQQTELSVQRLETLLHMCSFCKRIRDDEGWISLDAYVRRYSDTDVSHGLCPGCAKQHYPDYFGPDE